VSGSGGALRAVRPYQSFMPILVFALLVLTLSANADFAPAELRSRIAVAAERQVGVTTIYDPSYVRLTYPGGDLPLQRGVCADVVVRAFRVVGVDLQRELHEDMRTNFRQYPQMWGLRKADRNIDHRRVPNLMKYFQRKGKRIAPGRGKYEPGDVVAWRLPNGLHHIGVVSTKRAAAGRFHMIHNIGAGAQLEDVLESFEIIGHYRW
jgi:uncharacterized protein YijF (DUF1287 family)